MGLREIGPDIFRATSRRDSPNGVVVAAGESGPEVLLIDPGSGPDELWIPTPGRSRNAATTSLGIEHRAELSFCTDQPHVLINHRN